MQFDLKAYFKALKELYEAKAVHENIVAKLNQQQQQLSEHIIVDYPNRKAYSIDGSACFVIFFISLFIGCCVMGIARLICDMVFKMEDYTVLTLCINIVITIGLTFGITVIMPHRQYRSDLKAARENSQRQYEIEQHNQKVLLPEVKRKKSFYATRLDIINKRIDELYGLGVLPPKYQSENAAIMMHEYLENGLCITLRDCMLKFEEDAAIMALNERIDLLSDDLQRFKGIIQGRIASLQRSFDSQVQKTQDLLDSTQNHAYSTLESIESNRFYNTVIMKNIVDQINR